MSRYYYILVPVIPSVTGMTMEKVQDKGKIHREKLKTFQTYTVEDLRNRLLSQKKIQHVRVFCNKAVNGHLIHSSPHYCKYH